MILTGFSKSLTTAVPGLLTNLLLEPAATVDPTRFGTLLPGYVEATNEAGTTFLFFYNATGGYDPTFANYDYSIRGTMTIGEAATGAESIATAGAYTRPVLVVTGQEDNIFCNPTGLQATPGNCGSGSTGLLAQMATLYPVASNYTWISVPEAGHCWQFHYSALAAFGQVHDWLAGVGF